MRKLNCNPGNYQCGGRCQSNKKKCWRNTSSNSSDMLNQQLKLISNLSKKSNAKKYYESLEEIAKSIQPQLQNTFEEDYLAWGLQSYFSEQYKDINRFFYDKSFVPDIDIQMKAEALLEAFDQLKDYSKEEIINHYREKDINYDGSTVYRGMSIENPEFFNSFVNNHEPGSTIEYPSFTSTSVANPNDSKAKKVDGSWGSKKIQIEIKQKEGTAGKWVDPYKKSKDEGEILYPPGQKFMVEKVEKVEIEKLPPRLRDPLKDIFKSTDKGFGIDNLSISALLGGLSPSEIMTNPEFAWIKDLLKKRGLPGDMSTLDTDTKLKDILTLSRHKGGKSTFYELACKSLLKTADIKDSERTNEKECISAKIFLKEV